MVAVDRLRVCQPSLQQQGPYQSMSPRRRDPYHRPGLTALIRSVRLSSARRSGESAISRLAISALIIPIVPGRMSCFPPDKLYHLVVEILFFFLSHRRPGRFPFFCCFISPEFQFVLGYNIDIKLVTDRLQNALRCIHAVSGKTRNETFLVTIDPQKVSAVLDISSWRLPLCCSVHAPQRAPTGHRTSLPCGSGREESEVGRHHLARNLVGPHDTLRRRNAGMSRPSSRSPRSQSSPSRPRYLASQPRCNQTLSPSKAT